MAAAGRLENTYLPPSNADQAGGYNLPLPQQSVVATHTEAVVAPSNTYLPPVNNIVIEAKLQQPPKPLGGSGILKQQGLQSTLGFGAPAPLQNPQAAPAANQITSAFQASALPQVSSYTSQQGSFGAQQSSSLPKTSSFSFGSQQSSFSTPTFGSQQSSSLPKTTFSFGSQQQAPVALKTTPFAAQQSSFGAQQSFSQQTPIVPKTSPFAAQQSSFGAQQSFSQQAPIVPKTSSFGFQQSAFSSQQAPQSFGQQTSSSFAAKTNTVFGSQQASAGTDIRQGGFFSQPQSPSIAIVRSSSVNNGDGSYTYR